MAKGWLFLNRMSFNPGTVSIQLKIEIQTQREVARKSFPLVLAIVSDNQWNQEQELKCKLEDYSENNERKILKIDLRNQEKYKNSLVYNFSIQKAQTFHFVLRDCQKTLSNEYFYKTTKFIIDLTIKNDDSHHGSDEVSNHFFLPLLLVLTFFMLIMSKKLKQQQQQNNYARILLHTTLWINFIALLIYYLGFLIYTSSGQFYGIINFFYLATHSISESLLTILILFIGNGWTVTHNYNDNFDITIPLVVMLGFINLLLTLFGLINEGDHDKYHMYDSIPSYILVFFRLLSLTIFIVCVMKTYIFTEKLQKKDKINVKTREHLFNFGLKILCVGSIFFLNPPILMLMANFFGSGIRKQIVFFGVQFVKNLCNIFFTWMILNKKSGYQKVTLHRRSFFQDGDRLL